MNRSSRLACAAAPLALAFALAAASPAKAAYWSLFNLEGESTIGSVIVTYATLTDMLTDTNRTGLFDPGLAAANVVGTGSDGTTYWNLFKIEVESTIDAVYVTYATLTDMLTDMNRTGLFDPGLAAANVVGTGADIRSTTPIPEPGTAGLLAGALAALGALRRRRPSRRARG